MRYLYYDLGEQPQESWMVAHLRGSAANAILADPPNFDRDRLSQPFLYMGGSHTRSPAGLQIPRDGRWYLVIDRGGYTHHARAEKIDILTPDKSPTTSDADTTPVAASA